MQFFRTVRADLEYCSTRTSKHTAVFESAREANKHLRSVATQIPIADNLRDRLRWARWLPGLGMTIEVEKKMGPRRGRRLKWTSRRLIRNRMPWSR